MLYDNQGKYSDAEPLYQRALVIKEKALGPDHPDTALSLNNLASLYDNQGKYSDAEPLYQRALVIREKALGPDHPGTATSLYCLAFHYHNQGKYDVAEPLYQRALMIYEIALGPRSPKDCGVAEQFQLCRNQAKHDETDALQRSTKGSENPPSLESNSQYRKKLRSHSHN